MRYKFKLQDEKTLFNDTVKVVVVATGPADDDRKELETRVREVLDAFLPNVPWAFSGLTISSGTGQFPMFESRASVRIDAALNDRLADKAVSVSNNKVNLTVTMIDQSIPLHVRRDGEAEMRANLLTLAYKELETLNKRSDRPHDEPLRILNIDFTTRNFTGASMKAAMSNSYYEAQAGEAASAAAIGYQEKIAGEATVVITDEIDEPFPVEVVNKSDDEY